MDVKFIERLPYPPTLALIKHLASITTLPKEIAYIGEDGLQSIKAMALVNRGRLSEITLIQEHHDCRSDGMHQVFNLLTKRRMKLWYR